MQFSFVTIEAFCVALRQSAKLITSDSVIRVAALAQPKSGVGEWKSVRLDWNDEPDRLVEWKMALPKVVKHIWPTEATDRV
jgi:hypothetical protein